MVLKQFREGIREYGLARLLTEFDFLVSVVVILTLGIWRYWACAYILSPCSSIYNQQFLNIATMFSISLTAFILAGLAVLVSFTDQAFLVQLEELGIYNNIMFVFQFNLYLTGLSALSGILASSVFQSEVSLLVFLFFFVWMILSLTEMVDLIVRYGIQRAQFEGSK